MAGRGVSARFPLLSRLRLLAFGELSSVPMMRRHFSGHAVTMMRAIAVAGAIDTWLWGGCRYSLSKTTGDELIDHH